MAERLMGFIDLRSLNGRQTDPQLPLIDYLFPLLLPDFLMRWVRLRLRPPCLDNGSVSLLARGCPPGLGLSGKLVILSRQIGREQAPPLAIDRLVLKGAPGPNCRASVDVGIKANNPEKGTLPRHYNAVMAWGPKLLCLTASGYRGINMLEI
jgi:hypothetical protein